MAEVTKLIDSLARLRQQKAKLTPISVRISPEQRQRLERLHADLGGSRAELLRLVMEQGMYACAEAINLDLEHDAA